MSATRSESVSGHTDGTVEVLGRNHGFSTASLIDDRTIECLVDNASGRLPG